MNVLVMMILLMYSIPNSLVSQRSLLIKHHASNFLFYQRLQDFDDYTATFKNLNQLVSKPVFRYLMNGHS